MLTDYHMHTAVTIDGKMNEAEACQRALSQGIHEIAFTNHVMFTQPDYTMSPQAFVAHWERIKDCQDQYPRLKIRLGIEMDYYPGREEEIAASIRSYEALIGRPFDIVLGSIHELRGFFFSTDREAREFFKDCNPASLYCDYFRLALEAVKSRLFDVMAHPDLIKKYTHVLVPPVAFDDYRSAVEPLIEALIDTGVAIEMNTKGLKLEVGQAYPSNEFLELYLARLRSHQAEPLITLGSDAHKLEDVGGRISEGAAILRNLGVRSILRFEEREKSPMEL